MTSCHLRLSHSKPLSIILLPSCHMAVGSCSICLAVRMGIKEYVESKLAFQYWARYHLLLLFLYSPIDAALVITHSHVKCLYLHTVQFAQANIISPSKVDVFGSSVVPIAGLRLVETATFVYLRIVSFLQSTVLGSRCSFSLSYCCASGYGPLLSYSMGIFSVLNPVS
jgi:hypothetical protein